MAKGKKTGGKDWETGESGNPKGRGVYPQQLRDLRAMNRTMLISVVSEMIHMTEDDLDFVIDAEDAPALHKMIAKVIKAAISRGDHYRTNFIFEQEFGKLKEVVELEGKMNLHSAIMDFIKNKGGNDGDKKS